MKAFQYLSIFIVLWAHTLAGTPASLEDYSEGRAIPRSLTILERLQLKTSPIVARRFGASPRGTVRCPAEYDPVQGILLTYDGPSYWLSILDEMAAEITTTGNANVYVMANSQSEADALRANMVAAGADTNRIFPLITDTDTIWIRDYGPRFIYQGQCRAIINHTYNRPRPADNQIPEFFGNEQQHPVYDIPLVHGGGNFHLFSEPDSALAGEGHATELILDENPSLTESQIVQYWQQYQHLATNIESAFPTYIDSTQHIDMWMIPVSEQNVIISDWPFDSGSTQDQICDQVAADLTSAGKTVFRIPARSVSSTHYTYTNSVICNDLILIPSFTQSQVATHNAEALSTWQAAAPGKTVVQINCEGIISAAGAMHCIAIHYPSFLGTENPIAYSPETLGGQAFEPGQTVSLEYLSDDNVKVDTVSIELSTDSGANFNQTIITGLVPNGQYIWTVPDLWTSSARIRFTAHDEGGNSGSYSEPVDFTIKTARTCIPDVYPEQGGDGLVNRDDINQMLIVWRTDQLYFDVYPYVSPADYGDESVDIRDILEVFNNQGNCSN